MSDISPRLYSGHGINQAHTIIGSGKGGAMGLQPHLILRVLHWILIFYHRNIFFPVK